MKNEIKELLTNFSESVQALSNAVESSDYTFTDAVPEYMKDINDFTYEIMSFVGDEIEAIEENGDVEDGKNATTNVK